MCRELTQEDSDEGDLLPVDPRRARALAQAQQAKQAAMPKTQGGTAEYADLKPQNSMDSNSAEVDMLPVDPRRARAAAFQAAAPSSQSGMAPENASEKGSQPTLMVPPTPWASSLAGADSKPESSRMDCEAEYDLLYGTDRQSPQVCDAVFFSKPKLWFDHPGNYVFLLCTINLRGSKYPKKE